MELATTPFYPEIIAAWKLREKPFVEFYEIDIGVPRLVDTATYKVLQSGDLLDAILCLETNAAWKDFVELNESKLIKGWISW